MIVGTTAASLAIPYLFPTEADKATIELNKKLGAGQATLPNSTKPDMTKKTFSIDLNDKKTQYAIMAIIAVLFIMLVVL